jgi:hypothetical protein
MTKLLKELYTIALAPMSACPLGLEREWLQVVMQAMGNTYHLQCQTQPDDDAMHLARLFDGLTEQWLRMRNVALLRGVPLAVGEREAPTSVEAWRMLFAEADALNIAEDAA